MFVALLVACGGGDVDEAPDLGDASSSVGAMDASTSPPPDAGSGQAAEAGALDAAPGAQDGAASDARAQEAGSEAGPDATAGSGDAASDASPLRDASPVGDAGASCPFTGNVSYTLARAAAPSADQSSAYALITMAMDAAVAKYNCYTDITRGLRVSYDPNVATADGNVNGSIRFGARGNMTLVAAMHEISHVLGVASNEFRAQVQNGIFTGARATAQLREISGNPSDSVHSDGTHFWPHGLNYPSEYKTEADAVNHCKMVVAIRADLNL